MSNRVIAALLFASLGTACTIPEIEEDVDLNMDSVSEGALTILGMSEEYAYLTKCVERGFQKDSENIQIVPSSEFRKNLYPWFELHTAPQTTEQLGSLLERPLVRKKIRQMAVRYLVTVTGETVHDEPDGSIVPLVGPGGGGFFGYTEVGRESRLRADIWDLADVAQHGVIETAARGTFRVGAFFLPVPVFTTTETPVCRALVRQLKAIFDLRRYPATSN